MAVSLPSKFVDVPLSLVMEHLVIGSELKELANFSDSEAYWDGWLDCMALLLSGLTGKPVVYFRKNEAQQAERPELVAAFEDFRMENRLDALERDLKEERGY